MTDVLARPSRTDIVEATLDKISDLRREAVMARTMSRAFDDYANDVVNVIPTKGDVADQVAAMIAEHARGRAVMCAAVAIRKADKADQLEADLT
jgi:hypothetical protein